MDSASRDYHGAHTAFLLFVFAMSAWNGASFYFNYFAKYVPLFSLTGDCTVRDEAQHRSNTSLWNTSIACSIPWGGADE